tara:strand:- start:450 stop:722 length:273 start_codon:yes stop_codon:yes gene_type:complete
MSELKLNKREKLNLLECLNYFIDVWGQQVGAWNQVEEHTALVKKIKESLKENISIDVCFMICEESGDKIIDTEQMGEDFNNQMNSLINKY